MHAGGGGQVDEQRLDPVEQLQQQEVGDLGGAGRARLRQPSGQRIAALVQQADQLVGKAGQPRRGAKVHARRAVFGVEQHPVVGAPLDDAGHADVVGMRSLPRASGAGAIFPPASARCCRGHCCPPRSRRCGGAQLSAPSGC
jgi:hypothetical protein